MTTADGELPLVRRNGKSEAAFRTISEVSEDLDVPQHVLRFWESKFPQVRPLKRGGGRRYYRPEDVALLKRIRDLLYSEGYTIKGVQKLLREGYGTRGSESEADEVALIIRPGDDVVMDDEDEGIAMGGEDRDESKPMPARPGPPIGLTPHFRSELEGILDELEQLRFLLQFRE